MIMKKLVLALAASAAAMPCAAFAQADAGPQQKGGSSELEDIIVTAQRKEESLQRVPLSVTGFGPAALQRANATNVGDLAPVVPSLQVSPYVGRSSSPQFGIRAQRQADLRIVNDPSVGLYVSEVPVNRPYGAGIAAFVDVASVQVLKGPQGTLFGRNTTGGAILIVPETPKSEFQASAMLGVGSENLREGSAMLNVPLAEGVAFRVAAVGADRDGLLKNYGVGPDQGDLHHFATRASLRISPDSKFTSTFVFDYFKTNNSGGAGTITDLRPGSGPDLSPVLGPIIRSEIAARPGSRPFYSTNTGSATYDRGHALGIANITELPLNDSFTLKNIAAYRETNNRQLVDADGIPATIITALFADDIHQVSEEFQARYESDLLELVGGLFYYREKGTSTQDGNYLGGRVLYYAGGTNSSKSGYAQATWHFSHDLTLITGGRWTWDDRKIDARNRGGNPPVCIQRNAAGAILNPCRQVAKAKFDSPTWNVSLNYQLDAKQMIYAAHRRGYRSGGFTVTPLTSAAFKPYRPEQVDDVELGYKGDLSLGGDAALRINLAGYYSWFRDIQRTINRDLSGNGTLVSTTVNAASARIYGLELESTLVPFKNLSIGFTYTYTHAGYRDFVADGPSNTRVDLSDNDFANVPKHKGAISVDYKLPLASSGDLTLQGTVARQSSMQLDQLAGFGGRQGAFTLLSGRISWNGFIRENLTLSAWGKNLTNTHYFLGASSLYGGPFGVNIKYFGEPRTYGLQLSARF
jgi:iron complex outermembrane receptor protein